MTARTRKLVSSLLLVLAGGFGLLVALGLTVDCRTHRLLVVNLSDQASVLTVSANGEELATRRIPPVAGWMEVDAASHHGAFVATARFVDGHEVTSEFGYLLATYGLQSLAFHDDYVLAVRPEGIESRALRPLPGERRSWTDRASSVAATVFAVFREAAACADKRVFADR
jgi:hypothetical protein